jgi:putative copper export protein
MLSVTDADSYCNERTVISHARSFSHGQPRDMIIPALLLLEDVDFTAVDVIHEYVGFAGSFFTVGAAAFYFLLLRPALESGSPARAVAARSAARIGLLGAVLRLLAILMSVMEVMSSKHLSAIDALTRSSSVVLGAVVTLIAIFAFAAAGFAERESFAAWIIAGLATLVIALRGLVTTKLDRMVNPIHVFAASMWIGTLFVLAVAGIATMMKGVLSEPERSPAVTTMVNRFSTLALWSAGVLVLSGVTTAYIHIGTFGNLFTSIYGRTLLVKLALVATVFALGFYNNQRMKPQLGSDEATLRLHRSAKWELTIAALVLLVTAVLVNLPAPAEHMAH